MDPAESFSEIYMVCEAHLVDITEFCAPKFRKFCNSFERFSHKIFVISTPRACVFGYERTIDSIGSFGDAMRFAQRTLAEKKSNSVGVARRNFGNFAILS